MQINKQNKVSTTENGLGKERLVPRNFNELAQGDKFVATVLDIKKSEVTIRLHSGNTLTARSLVLPEARIGEETIFMVKENIKGQILLEMLKSDNVDLQNKLIKDALGAATLPTTKENVELVRSLIENRLPIDLNTIKKATFFNHASNNLDMSKVLFLLKEDFPAVSKSIHALNGILDKTLGLKENMKTLANEVLNTSNHELKRHLLEMMLENSTVDVGKNDKMVNQRMLDSERSLVDSGLSTSKVDTAKLIEYLIKGSGELKLQAAGDILALINNRLFISLEQRDTPEKLEMFYKDLGELTEKLLNKLGENALEPKIQNSLENIRDTIQFMNHVNNYKNYFQIPFQMNGKQNEAELFIMKDNNKKNNKKRLKEQASILIGIDFENLGRVETFVNKTQNSLSFQFKSAREDVEELISSHINDLIEPLERKGYNILQINFKKLTESFDVKEDFKQETNEAPRRYSFDMRV